MEQEQLLSMKPDYWRQMDFFNPNSINNYNILVVGAGAIGSYLTFSLQKMGVKNITVIDHDKIEAHNLPNQLFIPPTEETLKVFQLSKTLKLLNPDEQDIKVFPISWDVFRQINNVRFDVIFVCADNMEVRSEIFEYCNLYSLTFIIDGRVGGLSGNVFSCSMNVEFHKDYYRKSLWDNKDIPPLPCTGTITNYVAMGIAAEMAARFVAWTKSELKVIHTIHDYAIGQSYIMQVDNLFSANPDICNYADEQTLLNRKME